MKCYLLVGNKIVEQTIDLNHTSITGSITGSTELFLLIYLGFLDSFLCKVHTKTQQILHAVPWYVYHVLDFDYWFFIAQRSRRKRVQNPESIIRNPLFVCRHETFLLDPSPYTMKPSQSEAEIENPKTKKPNYTTDINSSKYSSYHQHF